MKGFLELSEDAAVEPFIEDFWRRHDPNGERPGNAVREQFDRRRRRADTLFDRPPELGHQTDRGVVYVLFGEPDDTQIETRFDVDAPPQEVWTYREPPAGLDGEPGRARYAFVLRADGTMELTHGLH